MKQTYRKKEAGNKSYKKWNLLSESDNSFVRAISLVVEQKGFHRIRF